MRNKIGIYKAFLHSAVAKYCAYAINLLSLIVLSRIFDQDDFGKIASIQVFVILFQYVAEGTIVPAIINLEFIKKRERDSINFTVMILAIAGFIVLVSLKSSLDALYVVTFDWSLYLLLALSVIPSVCLLYPQALIFREKKFYFISIAAVVAEVVSILIVVILENLIDLSRLLALKILSTSILNFIIIYFFCEKTKVGRPLFHVQLNIDFLRVGGVYQAAFSLLNYICRNVDNVVISKFSGAANLGLYDRAYQLMKYPISIISFAIMPALQPVLRSSSMDAEDSKRLHADLTIKLGSLAFLFSVFIYYFSGEIVQMLFGSKWIDVAELLKILALSLPAQIISSVSGSYFNANNRQNLLLMSGVLSVISCVFAISFGLFYGGLLGVCWGLFFAFLINCLFAKYLIYKYIFFENFSGYLFRILLLIAITLMATVFASWLFREVVVL